MILDNLIISSGKVDEIMQGKAKVILADEV